MRMRSLLLILVLSVLSLLTLSFASSNQPTLLQEDKSHVYTWNKFADDLYKLHQSMVKKHQTEVVTRIGGYSNYPKFYQEKKYINKANGKVISIVQNEIRKPNRLHVIEVYIRNKSGNVVRDYGATYLPNGHNAPVQTLINLHGYSQGMHGFRQFDVSGDVIYEYCEGKYKGKKYAFRLFEDDLVNGGGDIDKIMRSAPYKACFKSVANNVKKLIANPH